MNDKAIRSILIEYLKAKHNEIRIYQEKNIGSSICDLMSVTDCLTGYEIKSDSDNYTRLESQVKAYSDFFDRNYIVVGSAHRKSVYNRVPNNWGIIVIEETRISVEREAEYQNFITSRCRNQLSILWRLELVNLLTKSKLPLYTYKSKSYIIDRIMGNLNSIKIKSHIVYELMHRDYSRFGSEDYSQQFSANNTASADDMTDIPVGELVDTLSEKNLNEFTLDQWISLYRQAKEVHNEKQIVSEKRSKNHTEHKITYRDIEVTPGVPWVSKEIINDFIGYLKTGDTKSTFENSVNYEPITGHWHILCKKSTYNIDKTRVYYTYGLYDYNALYIFEATLNLREIKLYNKNNKYDEKRTVAALEKQKAINELFKRWVWQSEDRRWEIEEAYNRIFNVDKINKYDGSQLEFPKMNEEIALYPYQKDAVQRIISEKNTLLAFDIGAGKTFIMIAAAMKLREIGISTKNMFVVPNNIVGQWELIFKKLYPNSKVLTVAPVSFKPDMRQKVLAQIRDGDYDGIIIAYSCFEMIPLSGKAVKEQMNKKLTEIKISLDDLWYQEGVKVALKREAEHLKKLTAELMTSFDAIPGEITFDDLEINTLFVDEAHNFKNIPLRTNLRDIAGVNTKGSNKCLEMLHKVHAVQDSNNGRGVVFATGTPLCNSISDTFTMQMYLQYDMLKENNLDKFDNWVKTFAKPERVCEIDVDTSRFRFVARFSRFFNLPELSKMFSKVAVFHSMNNEDGLPNINGYDNVIIPRNGGLQAYMDKLCQRTEMIRNNEVEKNIDNMLKVSTDGRKAALDLRLVGKEQPYDSNSKIYCCVQKVMSIYCKHKGCAQIIFCDYSTPKSDRFNVYAELKKHLIENGIPEKEIAFIHSHHSEASKVALYEKVNRGTIRILIGSTFKLGIGANVQTKLKAVHHLDVPWRPADMVQREGRILRKGNENSLVNIYRYIAKGSFDAYSWQILETKQRFISQFLSGSTCQRSVSDLEENVLTYAQVKALAIADPRMKDLAEKENELSRLRVLSAEFSEEQEKQKRRIEALREHISATQEQLSKAKIDAQYIQGIEESAIKSEYERIKKYITDSYINNTCLQNLSFLEFNISVSETQDSQNPIVLLSRSDSRYAVKMGSSPTGNARRIVNFLKKLGKLCVSYENSISKSKNEISQAEQALAQKNPHLSNMEMLKKEIDRLKFEIEESEEEEEYFD